MACNHNGRVCCRSCGEEVERGDPEATRLLVALAIEVSYGSKGTAHREALRWLERNSKPVSPAKTE